MGNVGCCEQRPENARVRRRSKKNVVNGMLISNPKAHKEIRHQSPLPSPGNKYQSSSTVEEKPKRIIPDSWPPYGHYAKPPYGTPPPGSTPETPTAPYPHKITRDSLASSEVTGSFANEKDPADCCPLAQHRRAVSRQISTGSTKDRRSSISVRSQYSPFPDVKDEVDAQEELELLSKKLGPSLDGGANASFLMYQSHCIRMRWHYQFEERDRLAVHAGLREASECVVVPSLLPDRLRLPKVKTISCGSAHALLLTEKGVHAIGVNFYGQLGLGDAYSRVDNKVYPVRLKEVIQNIACGGHISFATSVSGRVYAWGKQELSNALGLSVEIDLRGHECVCRPTLLKMLSWLNVSKMFTSGWSSFCISHLGQVYSWGGGLCGLLGQGTDVDEMKPKAVWLGCKVIDMAVGCVHALALNEDGQVYTWGRRQGVALPHAPIVKPELVETLRGHMIVQVATGYEHSLCLTASGWVFGWGINHHAQLGEIAGETHIQIPRLLRAIGYPVQDIGAGHYHSLFRAAESGIISVCGTGVIDTEHPACQYDLSGLQEVAPEEQQPKEVMLPAPFDPIVLVNLLKQED